MTATGRRTPLRTQDAGELEAQRVACSYLVKGCERALFHFGLVAGETGNVEAAHVDQRAADIMRLVLTSWRDTLSLLPAGSTEDKSRKTAAGWMVMQIPGEQGPVLKRREH